MPYKHFPAQTPGTHRAFSRANLALLGIYAACSVMFGFLYFLGDLHHRNQEADVDATKRMWISIANFTGDRPFQYRVLIPALAHLLHAVLRVPVLAGYQLLEIGFLFLLLLAFRRYLALFLPENISRFAALGVFYPLLWNYVLLSHVYWPYDIPSIFFFVAGCVCLLQNRWTLYYPLFLLASLNRETSIFLILAYLLLAWKRQRPGQIAAHLLAQTALWLALKMLLNYVFRHNPGSLVENMQHLNWLLVTRFLHGNLTFVRFIFLAFGGVWILIPMAWRQQPWALKRLLWIIPPFLVGMSVVGVLDEGRIYNELIPVLLAPALFSLYVIFSANRDTGPSGSVSIPEASVR